MPASYSAFAHLLPAPIRHSLFVIRHYSRSAIGRRRAQLGQQRERGAELRGRVGRFLTGAHGGDEGIEDRADRLGPPLLSPLPLSPSDRDRLVEWLRAQRRLFAE